MKLKWLIVPLVALTLTACSGEGATPGSVTEEQGSASAGETINESSASHVDITDQQGSVEGFVGAKEDVEVERCEADGSGWISAGTVSNPTSESQDYRIYVAFNSSKDTKGLVQVDVKDLAAGASESWEASAPVQADNMKCVLRVERFASQ